MVLSSQCHSNVWNIIHYFTFNVSKLDWYNDMRVLICVHLIIHSLDEACFVSMGSSDELTPLHNKTRWLPSVLPSGVHQIKKEVYLLIGKQTKWLPCHFLFHCCHLCAQNKKGGKIF
ncbi:unnamed protein product [Meganyctiphanes norvegica]|uniref:Uncharacterized protein n=1 Tax=Meganyctiphanes norvegica TaxID=48144 RepID=A0AAV2RI50_MEGNR